MTDIIEKLKQIAARAKGSDASVIAAAIAHIEELEAELEGYRDDITDWQVAVQQQMRRRKDDK